MSEDRKDASAGSDVGAATVRALLDVLLCVVVLCADVARAGWALALFLLGASVAVVLRFVVGI
ncbi:MAG: hypothetical protein AAB426_10900 [Myxococcota bacterium]